jgi:uncharacterized protein YndB with AHSA1/START domain
MTINLETDHLSDRDLVLTRNFDAPPEKVYRAWTEPELLVQWFAPLPWTTSRVEQDVRPGGNCLIVMRSPEGVENPNPGIYLEVVPNDRLVFTDAYSRAWEPSENPFMTMIVTFENMDGKTRYTACARHWTVADPSATNRWAFTEAGGNAQTSSQPCWSGYNTCRFSLESEYLQDRIEISHSPITED